MIKLKSNYDIPCSKCGYDVLRTERRLVDLGAHSHIGCNKPKTKVGFVARWKIRLKK